MITVPSQHKIIFLNGPPRSGKDDAYKFLAAKYDNNIRHYKMSWPLKRAIRELFYLTQEEVNELERTKDEPSALLVNYTYREVQISLSEGWAKELFGKDFFGQLAVRRLRVVTDRNVVKTAISDCGFRSEAIPIINFFGAPNCLLVQITRPGKTFEGDSRSYLELSDHEVTTIEIDNRHDLKIYRLQILKAVADWLGEPEEELE